VSSACENSSADPLKEMSPVTNIEASSREVGVELVETIASPRVTHVRYTVREP